MEYDSFLYQHRNQERDEENPGYGEGIRQIHQHPSAVEIATKLRGICSF
jgi:hypothetical protein